MPPRKKRPDPLNDPASSSYWLARLGTTDHPHTVVALLDQLRACWPDTKQRRILEEMMRRRLTEMAGRN